METCSFHFPWYSTTFLTFTCFSLVSLVVPFVFLHFLHFFVIVSLVFFVVLLVSCIFLTFPCFFHCMFVTFSYNFILDFPCSPISHLSSFMFISCSGSSLVFLGPNLAVAVAAATSIAIVALLVLVAVVIAVVDPRHDGFKNKERERGWGEGAAPPPQGGRI